MYRVSRFEFDAAGVASLTMIVSSFLTARRDTTTDEAAVQ